MFLCNMTRATYKESLIWDAVGKEWWTEDKIFKFDCKITYFANDKFRVLHFFPMREDFKAEFKNSDPSLGGLTSISDEEARTIQFRRASYYS